MKLCIFTVIAVEETRRSWAHRSIRHRSSTRDHTMIASSLRLSRASKTTIAKPDWCTIQSKLQGELSGFDLCNGFLSLCFSVPGRTQCTLNVKHFLSHICIFLYFITLYLCTKRGFKNERCLEKTLISAPSPPYLGVILTLEPGTSCGRSG